MCCQYAALQGLIRDCFCAGVTPVIVNTTYGSAMVATTAAVLLQVQVISPTYLSLLCKGQPAGVQIAAVCCFQHRHLTLHLQSCRCRSCSGNLPPCFVWPASNQLSFPALLLVQERC